VEIGPGSKLIRGEAFNLGPRVEVADAEVVAVVKAIGAISKIRPKNIYFLFVDSQAAISRIEKCNDHYSQQISKKASTLAQRGCKIRIVWCPSHSKIDGNELADKLAKEGLNSTPRDEFTSRSHLKRLAKAKTVQEWGQDWHTAKKGKGTLYERIVQDSANFSLKQKFLGLPRPNQAAYIYLKTGIGYLKPFLKRVGSRTDDLCGTCGTEENTTHLVLRCPRYKQQRAVLRRALPTMPLTLNVLFSTTKGRNALAAFLGSTNIATRQWYLEGSEGPE
jgi:hypothetical protein